MQTEQNDFPRRNRVDLNTPAELAIRAAVDAVETAGCHPLLTEAVVLLGEAREKVADFVELDDQKSDGVDTEELILTARMLRVYGPGLFGPPNEKGQKHFGLVMMESAADAIDSAVRTLSATGPEETDWDVCQHPGCDDQRPDVPGPPDHSPWRCLKHRTG